MNKKKIEILGVTPYKDFPKSISYDMCKQISETDVLCIPKQKPNIEEIIQINVNICDITHRVICTPLGKKVIINGIKHIQVLYISDKSCQSVHCAHFNIPFCDFVLLKDYNVKIKDIFIGIEHISVKQLNCRNISLSVILLICPIFEHIHDDCKPYKPSCKTIDMDVDVDVDVDVDINTKYKDYHYNKYDCNSYDNCNDYDYNDCDKDYDYNPYYHKSKHKTYHCSTKK